MAKATEWKGGDRVTTLEAQLTERAKWDARTAAGMKYVRSTRQHEKRNYGLMYLAHLVTGRALPDRKMFDLTYMGFQAVELSLLAALKDTEE